MKKTLGVMTLSFLWAAAAHAEVVSLVCTMHCSECSPQVIRTVYKVDMAGRTVAVGSNNYQATITDEYITWTESDLQGGFFEMRINRVTGDRQSNLGNGGRRSSSFRSYNVMCERTKPIL